MRRGLALALIVVTGCSVQLSGLGTDDPVRDATTTPDAAADETGALVDSAAAPDFGGGTDAPSDDAYDATIDSNAPVDTALDDTLVAIDAPPDTGTDADADAGEGCKPTGGNLLDNASFEDPAEPKDTRTNSNDEGFLPGWKLVASDRGKFWLENGKPSGKTRSKDGAQAICLNSDGSGTSAVEQSFDTIVGGRYELRFWLTDENVAGPSDAAVKVEIGSEVRTFDRKADTGYVQKSLAFRAFDVKTTVRITDVSPSSAWLNSPFVDLVTVRSCE
jgi:hypothetical protein